MTAVLDGVDRVALARAVLARAEQRTGARSATGPGTGTGTAGATGTGGGTGAGTTGGSHAVGRAAAPAPEPSPTPGTVPPTTTAAASSWLTHPDRPPLPVNPALAPLLPEGALRRGASLVVTGSTSLVLALLSRASQEGAWVAAVGLPAVGLLAAQQAGVVLDRLAVVPRPGPDAATVLAALLDGVDVVVVGDGAALADADRRRLTARARERGTVLLSTSTWPGAHVVLAAEPVGWTGLGDGHGHLRRHRLAVTRSGRGSAGRAARAEVVLPLPAQASQPGATETHRGRRAGVSPSGSGVPGMPDMPDVPAVSAVPLRMVG